MEPAVVMPLSEGAYGEIFRNLSQPGYERVLVDVNGAIDLRGVRLSPMGPDAAAGGDRPAA
jgi:hypothetical protein